MSKRKIATIILVVIIVATLIFIWGNSIESVTESQQKSKEVLEVIRPVLEKIVEKEKVTDHLVRKMAHFVEFSALGIELALLLIVLRRVRWQGIFYTAYFGLTVALFDETIQIFSDRGSQVIDVWLDFSGVCFGIVCVLIVYGIVNAIMAGRKHKRRENS